MSPHLHIVSFDVPYPADYGGVIDVFNTIKSLYEIGVAVHLHCFEYGRGRQEALKKYCTEIHYYPRSTGHKGLSLHLPYIVASRNAPELWERLNADEYPVLLEGIHCSFGLSNGLLKKQNVFVRLHNVEHAYYLQQAVLESNWLRKLYFFVESRLLKNYEKSIVARYPVIALSAADKAAFSRAGAAKVYHVPPFVSWQTVDAPVTAGSFGLYVGNLSVAENYKAARWLLEKVFDTVEIPFVVAGKNPSPALVALAHRRQHTCIVENPGEKDLAELIAKAQFCIIPSFTDTGIKLKLIHTLFCGKHVITTRKMVKGTGLEHLCHVADTAEDMKALVQSLYHKPFTEEDKQARQTTLLQLFNNRRNAQQLMQVITSQSR